MESTGCFTFNPTRLSLLLLFLLDAIYWVIMYTNTITIVVVSVIGALLVISCGMCYRKSTKKDHEIPPRPFSQYFTFYLTIFIISAINLIINVFVLHNYSIDASFVIWTVLSIVSFLCVISVANDVWISYKKNRETIMMSTTAVTTTPVHAQPASAATV
jgi:hypothetical protein